MLRNVSHRKNARGLLAAAQRAGLKVANSIAYQESEVNFCTTTAQTVAGARQ